MHPSSTQSGRGKRTGQSTFWRLARAASCWSRRTHNDERGMAAIQVVLITAIAAVVLLAIKHYWPWWSEYFSLAIDIFVEN